MKLHEKNDRKRTRHHHSHHRQGRLSTSFTATTHEKKRQLKTMLCFIVICIFHFVDASDNWKGQLQRQQRQIITQRDVRHSTSHNKWLQQNTNKGITLSYSTLFDTFRGGDNNSSSSSKALIPSSSTPILEPEILDDETTNEINKKSATAKLSSTIQSTTKSLRKIRQKQIITFFLLRLSFLLLLPPSTLLLALTLSCSALMTSLRILTLTFSFSNTSKIIYAITRASLALLLSCLTGLFSPPFAIFGLMAALSLSLLDVAEPLIRIRYNREMKKVKRLHKLIQDPVLVEALSLVRLGVGRIADLGNVGGRVVVQEGTGDSRMMEDVAMSYSKMITEGDGSKEEEGDEKRGILRLFQREPKSTTTTTPVEISALQNEKASSHQLVETILSSPEAIQAKTKLIQKLPEPVSNWLQKQFQSIKDSGVLEVAAGRALAALQKEVMGAVEFMPYLEAIEHVRKEQQVLKKKKGQ